MIPVNNIQDLFSLISDVSVLFLGYSYFLGFLIVNSYHAEITHTTEYKMVDGKYLFTGVLYSLIMLGLHALSFETASLLAEFGITFNNPLYWFLFSLIALFVLTILYVFSDINVIFPFNFLHSWIFGFLATYVIFIVPIYVMVHLAMKTSEFETYEKLFLVTSITLVFFSHYAVTKFYALHFYSKNIFKKSGASSLGSGAPVPIQIGFDSETRILLDELGVLIAENKHVCEALLIDETDSHLVLSLRQRRVENKIVKIDKSVVKIISFQNPK